MKLENLSVQVNNDIYNTLGERWYQADDDPVALLRASAKHKIPWILARLRSHAPDRKCDVLDVGCGAGFVSNALVKAGHRITGVDLSQESLDVACRHDTTRSVCYICADAAKLPFPDESFDAVTAMDFLEHVEDINPVFAEISRVLKPGGKFFYHTFNRNPVAWLIAIKFVEWFVPNTPAHLHVLRLFLKPKEVALSCTKAGMNVVELRGVRPKSITAILRGIFTRRVPQDFDFKFSSSTLVSYAGIAEKKR